MNISEPEKNKSRFPSIKGEMLDRLSKEAEGRASHAKSIDHKKVYKRKGGELFYQIGKVSNSSSSLITSLVAPSSQASATLTSFNAKLLISSDGRMAPSTSAAVLIHAVSDWSCHSFVPVPCSVVMQLFVRKPVGFSNLMLSGDDVDCKIH